MKNSKIKHWGISLALICAGCSGGASVQATGGVSHGVTQGGSQDFARFRQIVEDHKVPASRTLDEVGFFRSEEHTSELQSRVDLVCRLLLEKKKDYKIETPLD